MSEPEDDGLPVHIEIGRSRAANGARIAGLEARAEAAEAELGRVTLAHLRTRTDLNTVRKQRDEARAALERVRAVAEGEYGSHALLAALTPG